MVRMLVLQSWYGLSDTELELQATDRISFRKFLGFPETVRDLPLSGLSENV
jgi:IS5 family transposase